MAKDFEISGAANRTLQAQLVVLSADEGDVLSIVYEKVKNKGDIDTKATITFSGGVTMSLCHIRSCKWVECDPGGGGG